MCYRLIEAEKTHHSVSRLARVLGVSRGGSYAWRQRGCSRQAAEDARLTERIRQIHRRSRATYGAPRIRAELVDEHGPRVGRKRVARLMATAGLVGTHRRRTVRTTVRDRRARPAPDLLRRDFTAPGPNTKWSADITYIPTQKGFVHLAVVTDLYSRRIVGWAMAAHLRAELVINALEMAIWNRRPAPGVIHHSDQGVQYTSLAFGGRCARAGIRPSIGSAGDCFDNSVTESFFATLETELLARQVFASRAQAKAAIFDYIEGFYNPRRRHSTLGQISPAEHERRYYAPHAEAA